MNKKALLVVDVQNDFLPPAGALAVKGGDAIVSVINKLLPYFDLIVATKDWHPPNHCSFAKEHGKKPGDVIYIEGKKQELWPEHCVQGTSGAEFSPLLNSKPFEKIFYKGTDSQIDSYSAFFDNAHLRSTGLGEFLKEKDVKELFVVGLATDYCVSYSVHDALKLGFTVTVVTDGCKGIDLKEGDVEAAIEKMRQEGARIANSSEIISHF